jgi:hypothetical protein
MKSWPAFTVRQSKTILARVVRERGSLIELLASSPGESPTQRSRADGCAGLIDL